jgi:hypothetical protein
MGSGHSDRQRSGPVWPTTQFAQVEKYAAMSKRKSFNVEGLGHTNPIPA